MANTIEKNLEFKRNSSFDIFDKENRSIFVILFSVTFGIWHIATNIYIVEPIHTQNAIHFAGYCILAPIVFSTFKQNSDKPYAWFFDVIYGLLSAAAILWMAYIENDIYQRTLSLTGQQWQFSLIDWVAGLFVIFVCLDLSRRVSGWIIPLLIMISLSYILFLGSYLPGIFRSASLPISDVLFRSLYNDEGILGTLTTISSTNITLFMIFGGFLVVSGASDFVIELSKIVAGRIKGGAGFVAVISSALTGTISGSAIANTASTGVITIPLMKSNGFRAQFAGGVEAASSTGGQLMPPIMGAGAFIMASYTSIPYYSIVMVSIVPALLYFMSVAFVIRIESVKYDVGSEIDLVVDKAKLLSGGLVFIIPLAVMIYMLLSGVTPSYSACGAIVAVILTSWATNILSKVFTSKIFNSIVLGPVQITEAITYGIRSAIVTAILLVSIGIINNAIVTSGVGNSFSLMIAQWSQGSILLAIVLVGLVSLVLGMGLPTTASYIILAILTAPALSGIMSDTLIVKQLVAGISDPVKSNLFLLIDHPNVAKITTGMTESQAWDLMYAIPFEIITTIRPALVDTTTATTFLLIAHLIIFWLSQDSNVTPPVCLTAFTAAAIAGSRPMATGFESWKLAKGLYIIPLMFAYTPLISGGFWEILQVGFFGLFGIYATNAIIQLYSEGPIGIKEIFILATGAFLSYLPLNLVANILGASIVLFVMFSTSLKNKKLRV